MGRICGKWAPVYAPPHIDQNTHRHYASGRTPLNIPNPDAGNVADDEEDRRRKEENKQDWTATLGLNMQRGADEENSCKQKVHKQLQF